MAKSLSNSLPWRFFLLCLFLASCSNQNVRKPRGENSYEYLSREEQTLEEILATPTTFTLGVLESQSAWKRTMLFMKEYAKDSSAHVRQRGAAVKVVTSARNVTGYTYKVQSTRNQKAEEKFIISCLERSSGKVTVSSKRGAHNLARFILTGQLERNYLTKQ